MITREQALAIYRAGPEAVVRVLCEWSHQVEGQQRQLEAQQKEIAELKQTVARLSKNSSNSSKPPSSDITQPKAKSHGQSQNKIGAQPGHPKHERALFPQGDIQTFHDDRLSACAKCDNPAVTFLDLPPRLIQPMELETFVVQFCIAPLIRDIKDLTGLPDAETPAYGKKLLAAVNVRFEVIHERENLAPDAFLRALERARESLLEAALNGVPSRLDPDGQEQKREAFNLAQRFRENGKAYFEFILRPSAPTSEIGPPHPCCPASPNAVSLVQRPPRHPTRSTYHSSPNMARPLPKCRTP